jgi:multidrug efflux system membrane fusion protein
MYAQRYLQSAELNNISGGKMGFRVAVVFISATVVAVCTHGCRRQQPQPQRPPALVTVAEATTGDVPQYLDEIGTCSADQTVAVKPQATGQITEIFFEEGTDVNVGDKLYTIDPKPYQATLNQAEANLAQGKAQLQLAQSEYARGQSLLPTNAISHEEVEVRRNSVAVAEAQIKSSVAAIDVAKVNLSYCFITSPIPGRTGQHLLDIGNAVTANSNTVLVTLQKLDPIYADFTIPENQLDAVRAQMKSGVLKTMVRLPTDEPNNAKSGQLTFLDNSVQTATGTIKLRAVLENKDRRFWPGQFVNVRLILSTIKNAVLVPSAATQISQKGPYVYVIEPNDTARLRLVKVGQRQGTMVVITEGIKPGERIVTEGQVAVTPGGKVKIQKTGSRS